MADNRNVMIGLAVIAVLLALLSRNRLDSSSRSAEYQEKNAAAAAAAHSHDDPSSSSSSVATKSLFELENEREILRRNELNPLLDEAARANQRVASVKSNMGWLGGTAAERAALSAAESVAADAANKLQVVAEKEKRLTKMIKPQLGLVSAEFYHETRVSIKESFSTVSNMAYRQSVWESLFSLGRVESLGELVTQFFVKYATVFLLLYPFAAGYLILWSIPLQIYSYCLDLWDLPQALLMWVMCTVIVLLPAVALYIGGKIAVRFANQNRRAQQHEGIFGGGGAQN